MTIIVDISKAFSRIYGFLYWNWNHRIQSNNQVNDPQTKQLLKSIKEANYDQIIPEIELIRQKLIDQSIDILQPSPKCNDHQKAIKKIAQHTASSASPQLNAIIMRALIQYLDIAQVLELGTSVGISSAYMGYEQSLIIDTIDLDKDLSLVAEYWHNNIGINNINYFRGSFEKILPQLLSNKKLYDLVFIDGDHTYEGTINNYNRIIPHCTSDAIFIIDDIYWSWGMKKAWQEIKQQNNVKAIIDLYHFGIIFLGKSKEKRVEYYQIPALYWDWFLRSSK